VTNGWEFLADQSDTERQILGVAEGSIDKTALTEWIRENTHR